VVTAPYTPAYDIYLGEGDGSWQEASRYQVWTNRYPISDPPLSVIERREESVLRAPDSLRVFHRIPSGTPYHVEHLFGFWRTTGSDTLFIRAEVESDVYYTIVVGTHSANFGIETIAWFCPRCAAEVRSATFDLRRFGLEQFWSFVLAQVREFNATTEARTCGGCGHIHPHAYGWEPKADLPLESEARALW
jgi:hypothetical protein